jgi:hypothetical protein
MDFWKICEPLLITITGIFAYAHNFPALADSLDMGTLMTSTAGGKIWLGSFLGLEPRVA